MLSEAIGLEIAEMAGMISTAIPLRRASRHAKVSFTILSTSVDASDCVSA